MMRTSPSLSTATTLIAAAASLASVLVTTSCAAKKPPPEKPPAPVQVAEARTQPLPVELEELGTATPVASVSVAPRVAGQLKSVNFEEGSVVDAGQLLFTIDPAPYQAALDQAVAVRERDEATLATAAADAERWRFMLARNLVAPSDADAKIGAAKAAKGTVAADRAAIASAKLNLSWTKVTSPIRGRIDRRQIDPGNLVQAGVPVVVVRQMSPMEVAFSIPQDLLGDVAARMHQGPIEALALLSGGATRPGVVSFLGGAVDPTTGGVLCRARFDNDDDALWPGSFVRVRLHLGTMQNAVVVPNAAVQTGPQGPFVFVVKPDMTADMRPVKTGPASDGLTAIQSGVQAGERVVVDGQLAVVPGAKVAIVENGAHNSGNTDNPTSPQSSNLQTESTTPSQSSSARGAVPNAPTTGTGTSTPNATTPNATTPNATTPNATTPNATTPNAATPNATTPNATTPNATTPNATTPNDATPNAATPSPSPPIGGAGSRGGAGGRP